ncbi:hypothetical protein EA796_18595 [Pseudomonas sp. AOB-7]|nr:hypothetical protein [Pseudomonas sp. AOB-7]ERI53334.1 hypothetical protein N878_15830 [Pseudomonas sp. EGD-AK9]RMH82889.1 hypothetical protein EA796_18595 [Pseudomonas sp. AOB-7]
MQGSERRDDGHSTPVEDPRPRIRWRFMASLALLAFLLGSMLGRLFEPAPLRIEDAEPWAAGLQVWFNREPEALAEHVQGALSYRFVDAYGRERQGRLDLDGTPVNWRIQREGRDLRLMLVAARPLGGEWRGAEVDGRWRVRLTLRRE